MAIGQILHASGTSTPTKLYTPWRGRGGNAAIFVADIIALHFSGSGSGYKVLITVQTKNSEDSDATDTSQDLGSFTAIDTIPTTPPTKYLSGLLELYRYKIEVFGDPAADWAHMRMLEPSWITN